MKFNAGWRGFTSWYLLPTVRVGRWWAYLMWLKFDVGVHW